ncbi:MAG: glutamine--fructose-6-phosphate transaminase (isomerizing) [Candidatus Omnitrophica bacterium]|nr:glutamine--fructose-6-phosphate transaminase (isomerizing) [Candidatus Omnitrophota bacterium]
MCGIVGYIGDKNAQPILLSALKRLEYRGYDSCGIGVVANQNHKINLCKTQGKIQNLSDLLEAHPIAEGCLGISHTRWATHGKPTKINAHPHFDSSGKFLIVHNGIVENYQEIKDFLKSKGYKFLSETDSEVIAHLISFSYKGNLLEAVRKTVRKLKGSFAIGVISSNHPDQLIAARLGSPLIIGMGKNENFIASDVPAILDKTRKIVYLKDGEIADMTRKGISIFNLAGKKVKYKVHQVSLKIDSVQKEGFAHFMLKEIYEQPKVLARMFSSRIKGNKVVLEGISLKDSDLQRINNIVIVACGTAYHAGLVGKYIIEQLARVPVLIDVSSEFRYRTPIIDKKTLVIAISQSGETADTLAAVREASSKGAKVISICNVVGSSLARESDGVLYTHAGPEIGVASTKAYTAQLGMLYLFALKLSLIKKKITPLKAAEIIKGLKKAPAAILKILKLRTKIAKVAKANSHFGCFLFLGRNINFPSALEGALKLKEISYIPAEGYAAGEMKHGPIALIDEYRAVVCIVPESDTYEKMISNIQEIRARKGKIIAIASEGDRVISQHANNVIYIPLIHKMLTPILTVVPLQLIAYYISVARGNDVDQPRNLAKSVTVE